MVGGWIKVLNLIVEEDVRRERTEHTILRRPSQKEGLIDSHAPCPQGANDPLVRWAVP